MQDSAYVFSETGHAVSGFIYVDDSEPLSFLFTRNTIQSQNSSGIILVAGPDSPDADTNNIDNGVISGNLFTHTDLDGGAHGILAGYNVNYKIKHNKILKTPYNIVIEGTQPMAYDSGGVYYNIIDVGGYYGVTVEGQDSICIYNNTFYNSNSSMLGYPLHFSFNIEASPKAYTYGARVRNNIFYSTSDPYMIFVDSVLHASGTFECDHNLYWCEEGNNEPRFYIQGDGGGELSWAEWQAFGYDANSVVVNPNFINTIDFVPAARLNYGTELGPEYQTGLAVTASWNAGTYPDTLGQDENWQVGAVLHSQEANDIGGDYYVAPASSGGSYSNPGTFDLPFLHLQQAIDVAEPGDLVYIRGGTYMVDSVFYDNNVYQINPEQGVGRSGLEGRPICYLNYPGEHPVFDYSLIRCDKSVSPFLTGFDISKTQWIHFRGLEFKNLWDNGDSIRVEFFGCWLVSNCLFENISIHDMGGRGYWYQSWAGFPEIVATDTTRWINCDVYNVCDTFSTYNPGYLADGWKVHAYPNSYFSWEGCRAWLCSDDGFDMSGDGIGSWKNCWAWNQGDFNGDGNGFKIGAIRGDLDYSPRIVKNCIAAFNTIWHTSAAAGFYEPEYAVDDTAYRRVNARYYNNVAYRNGIGFYSTDNEKYPYRNSIYRNNIAYGARQIQDGVPYEVYIPYYEYEESNNTWIWHNDSWPPWHLPNPEVTVTDEDFVTVDSATIVTQMASARQPDWSLPEITAFHLADGSDLIDAAYDVGLPFNGPAPDIGAFEYEYQPGTGNRYPTVEIVSPHSGSTIAESENVQINAIAADP
ncbi:MAG: right-handed parallel beta-helix repeat-containing protein, partial [Bacteroidetes bacterium]|nr:right-handed parallel beta-helix repeat-containing protein [Bacteroidota bacterium]